MTDLSKTVLLVADDDPSLLMMVSNHFRAKGFTVVEAVDGDEAWELAHEHLPHAVILDVMMPGMTGWEVCRRIRETVSLAHTGVVMLTGMGENLNRMTSPLYGADAYVDKPFEFRVLERRVLETLRRRATGVIGRADHADVTVVRRTPSRLEQELEALENHELDDDAAAQLPFELEKPSKRTAGHGPFDDAPEPTRRSPWPSPSSDDGQDMVTSASVLPPAMTAAAPSNDAPAKKSPAKKSASAKPLPKKPKPHARPAAAKPPTKKAAGKKPAAAKPPTKKAARKKPAVAKPPTKKPAAAKPPTKKAAGKKPAAAKPPTKKAARKKPAVAKPRASKAASKKPTSAKSPAKKPKASA